MTPEQHIENLESKMTEVEHKLGHLITLIEKMNKGLYGDEANDHIGVIARQKLFSQDIDQINKEIREIHKKNIEQDIALQTKKSLKSDLIDTGKDIVAWIIKIVLIVGILRGIVDMDALL